MQLFMGYKMNTKQVTINIADFDNNESFEEFLTLLGINRFDDNRDFIIQDITFNIDIDSIILEG